MITMQNFKILITIVFTVFVSVTTQAANGNWGGDGSLNTPYTISDAADLAKLATDVNGGTSYGGKYFLLTADIDLSNYASGTGWTPIGTNLTSGYSQPAFAGIFDGNYHSIKNLKINQPSTAYYVGLFGYLNNSAVVKNLTILSGNITAGFRVGGVVGAVGDNCRVINCGNNAAVTATGGYNGGVVGAFDGIGSQAINCYNTGAITGDGGATGGVTGNLSNGSLIENCYNTGTVDGGSGNAVGGVVGFMGGNGPQDTGNQIINCYNAGAVTSSGSNIGGVLGRFDVTNIISGCYYDNVICEKLGIGGILNQTDPPADVTGSAEGYNTADMQKQTTFDGWDFIGTWYMPANDYPHFLWAEQPAIVGTSPSLGATDAPLDGNIVIVFNKPMDPASGTAALTEYFGGATAGSLTAGSWTNDNQRITFQYSGLNPSMSYTVTISGFKDTYGKLVTTPGSYSFTTQAGSTATHVTANAGYGGTVSNGGSGLEYTITPNTSFVIDQVFVDGVEQTEASGQSTYKVKILDDGGSHSIFATFGYTVNFNMPTNGTLTVSSADVNLSSGTLVHGGQVLTTTVTPESGYILESLTVNSADVTSDYNNGYAYTVGTSGAKRTLSDGTTEVSAQGADIAATFTAQTYGVSIGTFAGGSVTADKAYYKEGETVILTILPATNYELSVISAYKTGDAATAVETLHATSLQTYEFTMPAYGVTVTATFQKTADQTAVEAAQSLIENGSYIVDQATANTEATVKAWLAIQINALTESATGITVTAADITITSFNAAVAGTSGTPSGTNGSFGFTVSRAVGSSNLTASKSGVITATAYVAPPTYTIIISGSTNGAVTASSTNATEGTNITLTATPANGYELSTIAAYKTGEPATTVVLTVPDVTTRTFSMPAYDVTVTATFQKTADQTAVDAAQSLIEGVPNWTVAQATANTEDAVKAWLADQINDLPGMNETGITVTAANITITGFNAAVAGTAGTPAGTNGSFGFTVSRVVGSSALTTKSMNGVITATVYVAPPNYTITISKTTIGTVTASSTSATEGTGITLTVTPASGYELIAISAYKTGESATVVETLHATSLQTYEFTMPAYDVTVTATFQKTADQLDREAAEAAKAAVEGGTYRIAQATGNDAETVKTWLVNTLNVLFGQLYNVQFRSTESIAGDVTITAITPAVAGTETTPDGINGSFKFTVTLTRNATTLLTGEILGVIVATPYEATPVKQIELLVQNNLMIQIINTGNTATGELTLALSGENADVFTLPATLVSSLAVGGDNTITLIPDAGLSPGIYTATLTVSAEGIDPVSVDIIYKVEETGINDVSNAKTLKAWTGNGQLHVSGLTAGKLWSVYDVSGLLIHQSRAIEERAEINLTAQGVYVVVSGSERVKVVYSN